MIAKEIQPPTVIRRARKTRLVFLAGTIDNGSCIDWQSRVIKVLRNSRTTFLNPRRRDWDSSLKPTKSNRVFREQVFWELDGLRRADLIVMYFAPGSKSPVTLLELGLHARSKRLIVCCPKGFWRKGNVDLICERYGIKTVPSLAKLIEFLKQ